MSVVLPVSMRNAKDSMNPFFIELYTITLRTGVMRLAACDESIVYDGKTYTGVPFQRGEITKTTDNIVDSCEISLGDCSFDLLKFVLNGFDFRGCAATIVRIQYPDSLEDPNIAQWIFSGIIDEPSFSDGTFNCKLTSRLPEVDCPNRNYRLACNSEFGDAECGMDLAKEVTQVLGGDGVNIKLNTSHGTDYWKDGVITIGGESRVVSKSSGQYVTVVVGFAQQNLVNHSATLVRGCNKTAKMCQSYNNMEHYGGFPAIPFESVYR